MEYLLNTLYKLGATKQNLEVKLFGGGQVLASMTDIGQRNILFAYDFLRKEGLDVAAADVGDIFSRKILYFPDTGAVKVRRITTTKNETIINREKGIWTVLKNKTIALTLNYLIERRRPK